MTEAVEFVLEAQFEHLLDYFVSLGEKRRESVFRRLARILHPDKNSHMQAKEAF